MTGFEIIGYQAFGYYQCICEHRQQTAFRYTDTAMYTGGLYTVYIRKGKFLKLG